MKKNKIKIRHSFHASSSLRKQLKSSVNRMRSTLLFSGLLALFVVLLLSGCADPYFKNDYEDNSPTSGKLKVYYDEGLQLHVKNQAYTFESQYPNVHLETFSTTENDAVQALYNGSCKAIIISRLLTEKEKEAFKSKDLFPKFSAVSKSGIALITNIGSPVDSLSYNDVLTLLSKDFVVKDSLKNDTKIKVLLDRNNSATVHYLLDSVLKATKFSPNCTALKSTLESIDYVAKNKNTVAFIDFAWLSDRDDSLVKSYAGKIKYVAVSKSTGGICEYPSQSSFKLGTYPFTRTVYVIRRAGEFTLAKGFESFVAGPKGQTIFLKQGLLPTKQQERSVQINMEPLKSE